MTADAKKYSLLENLCAAKSACCQIEKILIRVAFRENELNSTSVSDDGGADFKQFETNGIHLSFGKLGSL